MLYGFCKLYSDKWRYDKIKYLLSSVVQCNVQLYFSRCAIFFFVIFQSFTRKLDIYCERLFLVRSEKSNRGELLKGSKEECGGGWGRNVRMSRPLDATTDSMQDARRSYMQTERKEAGRQLPTSRRRRACPSCIGRMRNFMSRNSLGIHIEKRQREREREREE